jgi:hypothetical protein
MLPVFATISMTWTTPFLQRIPESLGAMGVREATAGEFRRRFALLFFPVYWCSVFLQGAASERTTS